MDQTKQTLDNIVNSNINTPLIMQRRFTTKETTYLVTITPFNPNVDFWVSKLYKNIKNAYVVSTTSTKYGIQRALLHNYCPEAEYVIKNLAEIFNNEYTHVTEKRYCNLDMLRVHFIYKVMEAHEDGDSYLIHHTLDLHQVYMEEIERMEKEYRKLRKEYLLLKKENADLKNKH